MLRAHATKAGLNIEFNSAGTENYHVGAAPDLRSIHHAQLRGYDLSSHRARQVCPDDFLEFDLILAADHQNLAVLQCQCPVAQRYRLALFLDYQALPDPYYGESAGFEKVLDLVEKQAVLLISRWSKNN